MGWGGSMVQRTPGAQARGPGVPWLCANSLGCLEQLGHHPPTHQGLSLPSHTMELNERMTKGVQPEQRLSPFDAGPMLLSSCSELFLPRRKERWQRKGGQGPQSWEFAKSQPFLSCCRHPRGRTYSILSGLVKWMTKWINELMNGCGSEKTTSLPAPCTEWDDTQFLGSCPAMPGNRCTNNPIKYLWSIDYEPGSKNLTLNKQVQIIF